MGLFDRLFGGTPEAATVPAPESATDHESAPVLEVRRAPQHAAVPSEAPVRDARGRIDDDLAVERYQYLLRTAPPETIEKIHQEAFSELTQEQREMLFARLSKNAPSGDAPRDSDPASLAVSATRSELRQPGTLERSMGGPGLGFGGGGSLLGIVAGFAIGSTVVASLFPSESGSPSGAEV